MLFAASAFWLLLRLVAASDSICMDQIPFKVRELFENADVANGIYNQRPVEIPASTWPLTETPSPTNLLIVKS